MGNCLTDEILFLKKMSNYNGHGVRYLIFPSLSLTNNLVFIKKTSGRSTDLLSLITLHFFQKGFLIHSFEVGCDYSIAYSIINFAYFESKILMQRITHRFCFTYQGEVHVSLVYQFPQE